MFFANIDLNALYRCGNLDFEFSGTFPYLVHTIITIIKIVVPILLIIFGMLDLMKGISAQKDDDIKKGQQILIKRLIAAALVFFVFAIVKVVISVAADETKNEILDCAGCFISNKCN